MPRDYSKTVIYRIPVGDDNYYGHTTQPLHTRKNGHKKDYRRQPNRKLYKAMREAGMTENDMQLIWVEDWKCENINQARARERYWVESGGTLNMNVPNRGQTEYKRHRRHTDEVYREKLKEHKREYEKARKKENTDYKDKVNTQLRNYKRDKYANDIDYRQREKDRHLLYYHSKYATDEEWRNKHLEKNRRKNSERVHCDLCGKQMRYDSVLKHKRSSCKGVQVVIPTVETD